MLFKNCLSYILAVAITQTKCDKSKDYPKNDDPTEIDPSLPNTGKLVCYYFAYDSLMDIKFLHKQMPTAEFFNKGSLSGWSLDFTRVGKKPEEISTTLIEDDAEAWGLIFKVSVEDYDAYRDTFSWYHNKKIRRSAKFTVDVDSKTSVICNTLVTVEVPCKRSTLPTKQGLKEIVDALEGAHIDCKYIKKINNIPTQPI